MSDKARKTVKQEAAEHGVKLDERVRRNYPDKAEGTARDVAISILKNWAAKYVRPEFFRKNDPQASIDLAVKRATEEIDAYTAALQSQLEEANRSAYVATKELATALQNGRAAEALAKERGEKLEALQQELNEAHDWCRAAKEFKDEAVSHLGGLKTLLNQCDALFGSIRGDLHIKNYSSAIAKTHHGQKLVKKKLAQEGR